MRRSKEPKRNTDQGMKTVIAKNGKLSGEAENRQTQPETDLANGKSKLGEFSRILQEVQERIEEMRRDMKDRSRRSQLPLKGVQGRTDRRRSVLTRPAGAGGRKRAY